MRRHFFDFVRSICILTMHIKTDLLSRSIIMALYLIKELTERSLKLLA